MTVPLFPGPTISKRYTTLLDATNERIYLIVEPDQKSISGAFAAESEALWAKYRVTF
ncbi:hypothetical protein GWO54_11245 [Corynebacterium macginleyi]|uniref:hypothetical protein n=1 Tax=Corynebacterium macginleyi TaxID=38290 RepID=UPI00190E0EBB|nr:hypothetical protein [Corynebacterium macginleyi]MBK4143064.1 hypothetical protein [Corynebacterium macginleyi]